MQNMVREGLLTKEEYNKHKMTLLNDLATENPEGEWPSLTRSKLLFLQDLLQTDVITERDYHEAKRPVLRRLAEMGAEVDSEDFVMDPAIRNSVRNSMRKSRGFFRSSFKGEGVSARKERARRKDASRASGGLGKGNLLETPGKTPMQNMMRFFGRGRGELEEGKGDMIESSVDISRDQPMGERVPHALDFLPYGRAPLREPPQIPSMRPGGGNLEGNPRHGLPPRKERVDKGIIREDKGGKEIEEEGEEEERLPPSRRGREHRLPKEQAGEGGDQEDEAPDKGKKRMDFSQIPANRKRSNSGDGLDNISGGSLLSESGNPVSEAGSDEDNNPFGEDEFTRKQGYRKSFSWDKTEEDELVSEEVDKRANVENRGSYEVEDSRFENARGFFQSVVGENAVNSIGGEIPSSSMAPNETKEIPKLDTTPPAKQAPTPRGTMFRGFIRKLSGLGPDPVTNPNFGVDSPKDSPKGPLKSPQGTSKSPRGVSKSPRGRGSMVISKDGVERPAWGLLRPPKKLVVEGLRKSEEKRRKSRDVTGQAQRKAKEESLRRGENGTPGACSGNRKGKRAVETSIPEEGFEDVIAGMGEMDKNDLERGRGERDERDGLFEELGAEKGAIKNLAELPLPRGAKEDRRRVKISPPPNSKVLVDNGNRMSQDSGDLKKKLHEWQTQGSGDSQAAKKQDALTENIKRGLIELRGKIQPSGALTTDDINAIAKRMPADKAELLKYFAREWVDVYGSVVLAVVQQEVKSHVLSLQKQRNPGTRRNRQNPSSGNDGNNNSNGTNLPENVHTNISANPSSHTNTSNTNHSGNTGSHQSGQYGDSGRNEQNGGRQHGTGRERGRSNRPTEMHGINSDEPNHGRNRWMEDPQGDKNNMNVNQLGTKGANTRVGQRGGGTGTWTRGGTTATNTSSGLDDSEDPNQRQQAGGRQMDWTHHGPPRPLHREKEREGEGDRAHEGAYGIDRERERERERERDREREPVGGLGIGRGGGTQEEREDNRVEAVSGIPRANPGAPVDLQARAAKRAAFLKHARTMPARHGNEQYIQETENSTDQNNDNNANNHHHNIHGNNGGGGGNRAQGRATIGASAGARHMSGGGGGVGGERSGKSPLRKPSTVTKRFHVMDDALEVGPESDPSEGDFLGDGRRGGGRNPVKRDHEGGQNKQTGRPRPRRASAGSDLEPGGIDMEFEGGGGGGGGVGGGGGGVGGGETKVRPKRVSHFQRGTPLGGDNVVNMR